MSFNLHDTSHHFSLQFPLPISSSLLVRLFPVKHFSPLCPCSLIPISRALLFLAFASVPDFSWLPWNLFFQLFLLDFPFLQFSSLETEIILSSFIFIRCCFSMFNFLSSSTCCVSYFLLCHFSSSYKISHIPIVLCDILEITGLVISTFSSSLLSFSFISNSLWNIF